MSSKNSSLEKRKKEIKLHVFKLYLLLKTFDNHQNHWLREYNEKYDILHIFSLTVGQGVKAGSLNREEIFN